MGAKVQGATFVLCSVFPYHAVTVSIMIYLIGFKTRDGDKVIRTVNRKINRAVDMFKITIEPLFFATIGVTPLFWALLIIKVFFLLFSPEKYVHMFLYSGVKKCFPPS